MYLQSTVQELSIALDHYHNPVKWEMWIILLLPLTEDDTGVLSQASNMGLTPEAAFFASSPRPSTEKEFWLFSQMPVNLLFHLYTVGTFLRQEVNKKRSLQYIIIFSY